ALPASMGQLYENLSCRPLEVWYFSARFSAVAPMESGGYSEDQPGLTNRQPMVVSARLSPPRLKPASGFSATSGARVMLSTPPARRTSPSPAQMTRAASFTASSPDPHSLFTVAPGTE